MNTNQTAILVDGLTGGSTLHQGDVFTIAGVYAVNAVTKLPWPYLQQFVVSRTGRRHWQRGWIIAPAIIISGRIPNRERCACTKCGADLHGNGGRNLSAEPRFP